MTKVKPNSGNETESDIFQQDIFKSDNISFYPKNIKVSQWVPKLKFLSFMTKGYPNNGNETKSDLSP